MTERLHFHFSLSCIGEGNGNPLQCSCLENPMDGGAWWAAIYGVAQSRTRLKWLSSSSSTWSRLPFSSTGDLPNPGINPCLFCLLHCRQVHYQGTTWKAWKAPKLSQYKKITNIASLYFLNIFKIEKKTKGNILFKSTLKAFHLWAYSTNTENWKELRWEE